MWFVFFFFLLFLCLFLSSLHQTHWIWSRMISFFLQFFKSLCSLHTLTYFVCVIGSTFIFEMKIISVLFNLYRTQSFSQKQTIERWNVLVYHRTMECFGKSVSVFTFIFHSSCPYLERCSHAILFAERIKISLPHSICSDLLWLLLLLSWLNDVICRLFLGSRSSFVQFSAE